MTLRLLAIAVMLLFAEGASSALACPWWNPHCAPPPPTLTLTFTPQSPSISDSSPLGTVITKATAAWSNGAPFTGTLSFGSPYGNDGNLVTFNGNNVVVNGDLSGFANTSQHVSVTATQ